MKKIQRTIDEKIKIIISYIGAYTNLVLLENELFKKETKAVRAINAEGIFYERKQSCRPVYRAV